MDDLDWLALQHLLLLKLDISSWAPKMVKTILFGSIHMLASNFTSKVNQDSFSFIYFWPILVLSMFYDNGVSLETRARLIEALT